MATKPRPMSKAERALWRRVRAEWDEGRVRGICVCLGRVVGWDHRQFDQPYDSLLTWQPYGPEKSYWWSHTPAGNRARRRVLDKLCRGQRGPRKVEP